MSADRFDPAPVLKTLKDFQRRTVEHVFKRMYTDKTATRRFLIADEVGLGKTLVARGIIAEAIRFLEDDPAIDRVDIVYVCSNAAIAQQNVNRLNITGSEDCALASRLTLLPLELSDLNKRKLNFVSFTPGTTFDLKYSTGVWKERRLLYRVLRRKSSLDKRGLMNMLRCDVSPERWRKRLQEKLTYDKTIIRGFLTIVGQDRELMTELGVLSRQFRRYSKKLPRSLRKRRNKTIGKLRRLLAQSCVEALEPDLIILDEFQRFNDLLRTDNDAGQLAHDLMEYRDARVLLLSATPYRMLSLYDEEGPDHYKDFVETLRFLYQNEVHVERVQEDLEAYRLALYDNPEDARKIRDRLRLRLMRVMVRTERVPETRQRDAMLSEPSVVAPIIADDIIRASALDNVVKALRAQEAIEYWKSAPYLLNFMKDYDLKRRLQNAKRSDGLVVDALHQMEPHLLRRSELQRYAPMEDGNARLRCFTDYVLGKEEWKLIWMPPSFPYTTPGPRFSGIDPITKSLVFSSWSVVPDVIAATCSYQVERERVLSKGQEDYFDLADKRKALLTFRLGEGRPEAMSTLMLVFPSPFLAGVVDPLIEALRSTEKALQPEVLLGVTETRIVEALKAAKVNKGDGRSDQSWYWAALARLGVDRRSTLEAWSRDPDGLLLAPADEDGSSGGFAAHVEMFCEAFGDKLELGAPPDDLARVLSEIAIGSPAVCAARALRHIAPDLSEDDPALLSAAVGIAEGFRSLFNSPDVRSFLESSDVPYWRQVLKYCIDGNLQAVLDEYCHTLKESLGLFDRPGAEVVDGISDTVQRVLSIRTSNLTVDEISLDGKEKFDLSSFKMRCKYALRFADLKDDSENVLHRAGVVRDAFNSPFRPFILATTSIGQEGLDFHGYCHRIWHWNLPRNPVDMEQREGRVNRYKGHAVRKNVARGVSRQELLQEWDGIGDPWDAMFDIIRERQRREKKHLSDISPYWIYDDIEDPCRVERLIPLPPFSSEHSRLKMLKRNLVVYRLAFGQPRQQDLLDYLTSDHAGIDPAMLSEMQLDLSPK